MIKSDRATTLRERLEDRFGERERISVAVTDDAPVRLEAPDRTVLVERRRGPDESPRWTLTLRSGDETVSKFGPIETTDAVLDRAETLLETAVRYTVCCDG